MSQWIVRLSAVGQQTAYYGPFDSEAAAVTFSDFHEAPVYISVIKLLDPNDYS